MKQTNTNTTKSDGSASATRVRHERNESAMRDGSTTHRRCTRRLRQQRRCGDVCCGDVCCGDVCCSDACCIDVLLGGFASVQLAVDSLIMSCSLSERAAGADPDGLSRRLERAACGLATVEAGEEDRHPKLRITHARQARLRTWSARRSRPLQWRRMAEQDSDKAAVEWNAHAKSVGRVVGWRTELQ